MPTITHLSNGKYKDNLFHSYCGLRLTFKDICCKHRLIAVKDLTDCKICLFKHSKGIIT